MNPTWKATNRAVRRVMRNAGVRRDIIPMIFTHAPRSAGEGFNIVVWTELTRRQARIIDAHLSAAHKAARRAAIASSFPIQLL